jgi:P27 family predicted phage terminase small subunit
MRGRKPQPAAIKEQKAAVRSKRKRRDSASRSAAVPPASAPPPSLKGEGRKVWDRLAATLRQAKLLTDADAPAFARYCRNTALWEEMRSLAQREGIIYETETYLFDDGKDGGETRPARANKLKRIHPAFVIADRLERQLLAIEDRFGMNPAERQRIFAARAQTGVSGDLFAAVDAGERRPGDPAAEPAKPAEPIDSPIGLLN